MVKFIKQVGHLLQWPEIYCFQKFFPILTRWQVLNATRLREMSGAVSYVTPKEIIKKRVVKGVASLEILWQDENGIFKGLIPDDQLKEFEENNPKGLQDMWSTVEPFDKVEIAYPQLVEDFIKSKEKPKKATKKSSKTKTKLQEQDRAPLGSLENLNGLIEATNEIAKTIKPKRANKTKKPNTIQGLQMIDKFLKKTNDKENLCKTPDKFAYRNNRETQQSSTPITKNIPSDLDSDIDDDDEAFNMSDIVNGIVSKTNKSFTLTSHKGKQLCYEAMPQNISILLEEESKTIASTNSRLSIDDLDIMNEKRLLSNSFRKSTYNEAKRMSLDDSFDVLVKMGSNRVIKTGDSKSPPARVSNIIDRFKDKHRISLYSASNSSTVDKVGDDNDNVSYFFNSSLQVENEDVFEKFMETSLAKHSNSHEEEDDNEILLLSD